MREKSFLEKYGLVIGAVIATIVVQSFKRKETKYWERQNEELAKMTNKFFEECRKDPHVEVVDF